MKKLLTILLCSICLTCYAETYEVHCGFVDYKGQPYEFAKGFVEHVEVWESIYNEYYMVVYHGKNHKYDMIIPYGKDKQTILKDFEENNRILFKDKNPLDRIIFQLRKNSYNHLREN